MLLGVKFPPAMRFPHRYNPLPQIAIRSHYKHPTSRSNSKHRSRISTWSPDSAQCLDHLSHKLNQYPDGQRINLLRRILRSMRAATGSPPVKPRGTIRMNRAN